MRWECIVLLSLIGAILVLWSLAAVWDMRKGSKCDYYRKLCPYISHGYFVLAPLTFVYHKGILHKESQMPFLQKKEFRGHALLESNWERIRDEARSAQKYAVSADKLSPTFFKSLNKKQTWTTFPFFWYGKEYPENQRRCPVTAALLKQCPQVKAAMFSVMAPGTIVPLHRGPFRGCVRYHLGLVVPRDRERCFIEVNGERYHWAEGEGQVFDDTFSHRVENKTGETRIILFLDIQRDPKTLAKWLHKLNTKIINSSIPRTLSRLNSKQERKRA